MAFRPYGGRCQGPSQLPGQGGETSLSKQMGGGGRCPLHRPASGAGSVGVSEEVGSSLAMEGASPECREQSTGFVSVARPCQERRGQAGEKPRGRAAGRGAGRVARRHRQAQSIRRGSS